MGNLCHNAFSKKKKEESIIEVRLKSKSEIIKKESLNVENMDWHFKVPLSFSEKKIKQIYEIEKESLGEGHFGKVKVGYFIDNNYRKFAIKIVKRKTVKSSFFLIGNELNIIRSIDHPNIINFYETYFNKVNIYFVMELCLGGTLEEEIISKKTLKENVVIEYIFQILLALSHLHYRKISHRDIKAENILFLNKKKKVLKLTDFGLSKYGEIDKMKTLVGTPYYVAPEVLNNNYNYKCDSWSIGVLIFYMLSGEFPFEGENTKEIFKLIKKGKFSFSQECWKSISEDAKDVIKCLLKPNFKERSSITEIIDKKWFHEINTKFWIKGKKLLKDKFINKVLSFQCKSRFKKEILKLAVNLFDNEKTINDIRKAYFYLDYANNGCISKNELIKFCEEENIDYEEKNIDILLKDLNLNSENSITYTEFIIASLDLSKFLNNERIKLLYNRFNIDNSEGITDKNLKECFARFGFLYNDNELKQMIDEFDYLKNNQITFEEFLNKLIN